MAIRKRHPGQTAPVSHKAPTCPLCKRPAISLALVDAGVRRVVVGMVDPDERVNGGGIQTLRDNGIEVAVGVEEGACRELNREFIARVTGAVPP